jgi:uncharacterized membrane protein HdeD (DUF308 family)
MSRNKQTKASREPAGPLEGKGNLFFVLGMIFDTLGVFGIVTHFVAGNLGVLPIGMFFLMGGLAQIVTATQLKGWPGRLLHSAIGAGYAFLGAALAAGAGLPGLNPVGVGAYGVFVAGLMRTMLAFKPGDRRGGALLAAAGVLSLCLGGVMWFWEGAAEQAGVLLSLEFFNNAAGYMILGVLLRTAAPAGAPNSPALPKQRA